MLATQRQNQVLSSQQVLAPTTSLALKMIDYGLPRAITSLFKGWIKSSLESNKSSQNILSLIGSKFIFKLK